MFGHHIIWKVKLPSSIIVLFIFYLLPLVGVLSPNYFLGVFKKLNKSERRIEIGVHTTTGR